jgi:mxaL protein
MSRSRDLARRLRADTSPAVLAAAALLAIALAMPPVTVARRTVDAIVVLDVTQSMDVDDMTLDGEPVTRLAFARESARRALRALPCGSRIGWAAFTEYRTLLLLAPIEVCSHYGDLLATLEPIDGRVRWAEASEISKGVFWAMRAARDLGGDPAIVFVTDGHESPPLAGARFSLFEDLQPGQVKGWLAGVGGPVPRPIPRTDQHGVRVGFWRAEDVVQRETAPGQPRSHEERSWLHDAHLRNLAAEVGFGYATLQGDDDLATLLRDERLARVRRVPTDLSWVPAALALALLACHFRPAATGTWWRRLGAAVRRIARRRDASLSPAAAPPRRRT